MSTLLHESCLATQKVILEWWVQWLKLCEELTVKEDGVIEQQNQIDQKRHMYSNAKRVMLKFWLIDTQRPSRPRRPAPAVVAACALQ